MTMRLHGLGINPKDGGLFVATHTGLFRAAPDERTSARVALSSNAGRSWRQLEGKPSHGTIKRSTDSGTAWSIRAVP